MRVNVNISFILGVGVMFFLLGCMLTCNCTPKRDTVTKTIRDTSVIILPSDASKIDNPTIVHEKRTRIDSFFINNPCDTSELDLLLKAANALLNEYSLIRDYRDTAIFKNGIGIIESRVQFNKLQEQKLILDSIKQTSITVKEKPRNSVWLGASFNSDLSLGPSIMFQHKRGWSLEAGASLGMYNGTRYQLSFKRKLKLKK